MNVLNLRSSQLTLSVEKHARFQNQLTVGLSHAEIQSWVAASKDALSEGGEELRVDMPQGWTIYWKARAGESRFLLAHPETDLWVATFTLGQAAAQSWLTSLQSLLSQRSPQAILSQSGPVSRLSNLELVLTAI